MDHIYFGHGIVALRLCLTHLAMNAGRSFLGNNQYFAHQYSPRASRVTVAFPSVPSIISTKCTDIRTHKMETRSVLSRDRQIKGMIQRIGVPKCFEGVTRSVFCVPVCRRRLVQCLFDCQSKHAVQRTPFNAHPSPLIAPKKLTSD